jgi:aryl-phospho-beta-D-glucosidase BglC (GH1 family)
MLSVHQNKIVDEQGQPVQLRGVCIGGWMNMENFINGYPGVEHSIRKAMADALGTAKAQFLFDRWLDYFLAEEDIAYLASLGVNVVRLALNYRHFESDTAPFTYIEKGFARLERAVQWCAKYNVYAILDLHAVQGWQSPDWHCDNANAPALLWHHPHFQDRWVALWEEFARRYKGNRTIAGYDVVNEPLSYPPLEPENFANINRAYRRIVRAIRAIDPDHIIFLEGDTFAGRFNGLDAPFADNLVYSGHSYSPATSEPGAYPGMICGSFWDAAEMERSHLQHEAVQFAQRYNVPLWMGEFGAPLNGPANEIPYRLCALDDQIAVFEKYQHHWTIWTYKDIGVMGLVNVRGDSKYSQFVAPINDLKRKFDADAWMVWLAPSETQRKVRELAAHVRRTIGDRIIDEKLMQQNLARAVMGGFISTLLEPLYAKRFKGLSEKQIDELMQSFAFKSCMPNDRLIRVVKKNLRRH